MPFEPGAYVAKLPQPTRNYTNFLEAPIYLEIKGVDLLRTGFL
jgi:hypothetical protein